MKRIAKINKTLVLLDAPFYRFGLDRKEHDNILFLPMLRWNLQDKDKFIRAIRKVWLTYNLPGREIWLESWVKVLNDYDTVVLGDAGNTTNVIRFIRSKNKNIRIIVWYRNPVKSTISPNAFKKYNCELWSFDQEDCRQYEMNYNPQFYMRNMKYKERAESIDAYFIGSDKGRRVVLDEIFNVLSKKGYRCRFDIVGVNSETKPYYEVLNYISASKVIIDCLSPGQSGMTLRPMEALFYNKKLISNSYQLLNMDFYNANNIFIWGKDSIKDIDYFMNTPYKGIDKKIINKYDLNGWVSRFYE